ncbi:MAG TPA: hypothetical protein VHU90_05245 [Galbitalea sp.]|nr:hypothetical protein [Galbitalea sp.]
MREVPKLLRAGRRTRAHQEDDEPIFNFDRQPLLLLAVNFYAARDAFGHDDRFRGSADSGASFVLRTLR